MRCAVKQDSPRKPDFTVAYSLRGWQGYLGRLDGIGHCQADVSHTLFYRVNWSMGQTAEDSSNGARVRYDRVPAHERAGLSVTTKDPCQMLDSIIMCWFPLRVRVD